MRKQLLAIAAVVAIASGIQFGCSGKGAPAGFQGGNPGSVVVLAGDTPLCSVLSFSLTVSGLTLSPQGGGTPVSVLSSGSSIALDFASLMDFTTMLTLSSIPAGTYTQLNVTVSNPQLTYLDASTSPPAVRTITPTVTPMSVSVTLSPAVTVSSNGTVGLNLDFNLLKSVLTNSTGQITGTVNPIFAASPATPISQNNLGDLENLEGIVQSVSPTSSNTAFTGSFVLQSATGTNLTLNAASSTRFDGVPGLSDLAPDMFLEVHAHVDTSGNLVADEVKAEASEDATQGKVALVGLITSVTRDAQGNATSFNLFVREEHPSVSSRIPARSTLPVTISSATAFNVNAVGTNFAGFSFGPATLGIGQQVVVHAQLPSGSGTVTSASARSIFLGLQSIIGNLSVAPNTPVVVGSDGLTGGFTLIPCSAVFQSQPITVITSAQTAFAGISSLSGLTSSSPTLIVKGLMVYQQSTGTSNSVSWLPPANVQVAKQVHQLP